MKKFELTLKYLHIQKKCSNLPELWNFACKNGRSYAFRGFKAEFFNINTLHTIKFFFRNSCNWWQGNNSHLCRVYKQYMITSITFALYTRMHDPLHVRTHFACLCAYLTYKHVLTHEQICTRTQIQRREIDGLTKELGVLHRKTPFVSSWRASGKALCIQLIINLIQF